MRKCLVLLLVMVMLMVPSSVFAQLSLQLAHVYEPEHPFHKGSELAAQIVSERTNGRIKINIYPASQLGTEEEITEAVIHGSIPIVVSGAGQIGNLYRPIYVAEMPYIFRDIDHVMAFNESEIGQRLLEGLRQELGVRAVGASTFGIRHITSNKPIRTPDDLVDFRLRVPEQHVCIEYAKALGAEPTPIAYAEAYMALQQGVVDGLENPLSAIYAMRFYEVQKYINLTRHVTNACYFLMNDDIFLGLSEEDQQIILEAFAEASYHVADLMKQQDEDLIAYFKDKGVTIVEPDVDAFVAKAGDMAERFKHWWSAYGEDLHVQIREIK